MATSVAAAASRALTPPPPPTTSTSPPPPLPQDPTAHDHTVKLVLESLHFVAPYLTSADRMQMAAVLKEWTKPYRSLITALTVGEPPSGMGVSGHWTSLHNLLSTLDHLQSLQVTHQQAVFGVTKCLGFLVTEQLTSLDLSHHKIWRSDETRLMDALAQGRLPLLERLLLVDTGLGDRAIQLLAGAIRAGGCRKLIVLELSDNSFRNALLDLAMALCSTNPSMEGGEEGVCPVLKVLGLGGNALGKEGMELLVQGLSVGNGGGEGEEGPRALPCLEELNVVECGLELKGLEALCPGLQAGPLSFITALRLNANRLGCAGVALLASALGEGACPLLQELYLGANQVEDSGVHALADVLGNRACLRDLRRLNLAFNMITPDGVWALLELFKKGGEGGEGGPLGKLEHCDLYMNEIQAKHRPDLQAAFAELAPTLRCLI